MTAMDESDLDSLYGEFCRALSDVGEAQAPLLLARFALLAIAEIGDVERVQRILTSARDCEAAANSQNDVRNSTPIVRG
jgi:hypothetical protein